MNKKGGISMSSYIISYDKSNEDIPVLTVSTKEWFSFGEGIRIVNVITGNRAVAIWEELTKKAQNKEV
jgi:hypothetical protein